MSPFQTVRRSFLRLLAGAPCAGLFLTGRADAQAPPAAAATQGRDICKELGVRTFINAGGTYTTMTASCPPPEVQAAMNVASKQFMMLDELQDKVGQRLATLLRCEAAMVSAGCSSAMMLGTAACVAGADAARVGRLPDTTGMKNEVVFQVGHRPGYHALQSVGVKFVQVANRQELENAINDKTAMMFFLNHNADRAPIKHEEFIQIAKAKNIPTMIDAAADVPPVDNLYRFQRIGFDLVCFSGGKGLRGPQSTGLLLGRKDLIAAARRNNNPNNGVGRTNKVTKDCIVGLLVAVESFINRDQDATWREWEQRCNRITQALAAYQDVRTTINVPAIANHVPHLQITWDATRRGVTPQQVRTRLRQGNPSIELAPNGGGGGLITVGVWMMDPGDDAIVAERLRVVLGGGA
jgi:uncharacterized pyridoxal phosphate-dependent enzyme